MNKERKNDRITAIACINAQ